MWLRKKRARRKATQTALFSNRSVGALKTLALGVVGNQKYERGGGGWWVFVPPPLKLEMGGKKNFTFVTKKQQKRKGGGGLGL